MIDDSPKPKSLFSLSTFQGKAIFSFIEDKLFHLFWLSASISFCPPYGALTFFCTSNHRREKMGFSKIPWDVTIAWPCISNAPCLQSRTLHKLFKDPKWSYIIKSIWSILPKINPWSETGSFLLKNKINISFIQSLVTTIIKMFVNRCLLPRRLFRILWSKN